MATESDIDLLVIGGGVNGAGIARDAAGRGLRVLLCEQTDLASGTSSASTKLIHGGLRYLEYYQFRLVRELLIEREVLLAAAPHIIRPLRFVLPHNRAMRPAWLVRLGLFLYDHLGGREKLPGSRSLDLKRHPAGRPLRPELSRGFEYSDCWVEDSRLVVLNALDAAERGARILTRTKLVSARRDGAVWRARLRPAAGEPWEVTARAVVNASGPWVAEVQGERLGLPPPARVRLVKGSHIVVPQLFDGPHAYILQSADRRIVFAIPYEEKFTLIGTTDLDYEGDPGAVGITSAETDYLCRAVSLYFRQQVAPADVVWSYSGVRPLYGDDESDASAVSRDYVIDLDAGPGRPPLLSVYGGKITTYRRLAEQATDKLAPLLGAQKGAWTAKAPLPGGDIADFDGWFAGFRGRYPSLPEALVRRLARAYGTRAERLLGGGLGRHYGDDLYEAEVTYLVEQEWARTAEDILWRRSKLGLHVSAATKAALESRLAEAPRVARAV